MCRAYTLTKSSSDLENHFKIEIPEDYMPRFNARPSQLLPVITQENLEQMSFIYWGIIPSWSKNKTISEKLINVKAESINELVAYKSALENRRCLIPADGFYNWKQISKRGYVPYRYTLKDAKPFYFAGIWEEFETDKGGIARTFVIITTRDNTNVNQDEQRIPFMLTVENANQWLSETNPKALFEALQPISVDSLFGYPVSPRVNNPEFDDPGLIDNTPPADQFGNYSLFD